MPSKKPTQWGANHKESFNDRADNFYGHGQATLATRKKILKAAKNANKDTPGIGTLDARHPSMVKTLKKSTHRRALAKGKK